MSASIEIQYGKQGGTLDKIVVEPGMLMLVSVMENGEMSRGAGGDVAAWAHRLFPDKFPDPLKAIGRDASIGLVGNDGGRGGAIAVELDHTKVSEAVSGEDVANKVCE